MEALTKQNTVLGILAHVDAGKTTLTEAILLKSGSIRRAGRVDHKDTFLDTDVQERERGITIYAKNALFSWKERPFTLIDTPGHTDLAGEAERTLSVLDAAVLLISAPDSVQGHTLTLWKLLERYNVPTLLFINKMDMPGVRQEALMADIKQRLSPLCALYGSPEMAETAALLSDELTEAYLETGLLPQSACSDAFNARRLFPCVFGSALRFEGVETLLNIASELTRSNAKGEAFSALIYKIAHDKNGEKLAFLKVTGGTLRVRMPLRLSGRTQDSPEEKAASIRFYSGEKYTTAELAPCGSVCAVTGLKSALAGDRLGVQEAQIKPELEPVFTYRAVFSEGQDPFTALAAFKQLEEEDPLLGVSWDPIHKEIHVRVMGDVSLEILTRTLLERFGLRVGFDAGSILYKETIVAPVNGYGHYEPLRHYAEVHLRLSPGARGSGIVIRSEVSTDDLALSWQRLIATHLTERQHRGVLTGAPLTDVIITITAGRAHLKHTEGGDFRQATYRAVRQALMQAESVLLEPSYKLSLSLPEECCGRAMNDITLMGGRFDPPQHDPDGTCQLTAYAPVRRVSGYQRELSSYSRGMGHMTQSLYLWDVCPDQASIVSAIGYDPEADLENPASSVFCSHGAGVLVPWQEAKAHMHIETERVRSAADEAPRSASTRSGFDSDEELKAIFERTYGKIEPRRFDRRPVQVQAESHVEVLTLPERPEYLLVDGYNIIYAWSDSFGIGQVDLDIARRALSDMLDNYAATRKVHIILVFDAYKVRHNPGSTECYGNIEIIYTREAQTADSYIEKLAHELSALNRVRVATGDGLEQLIILGSGALRMTARELLEEINASEAEIRKLAEQMNRSKARTNLGEALRDALQKKEKP